MNEPWRGKKSEELNTNEDRIDKYMDKIEKKVKHTVGKEERFGFQLPTE